jgi:hypothetical protein
MYAVNEPWQSPRCRRLQSAGGLCRLQALTFAQPVPQRRELVRSTMRHDRHRMPRRPRAEAMPQKPHDALIKFTFSQREHAAGLLKAALPPEVTALITWSTLELETIDFVDSTLRGRHADLLFSARIGEERLYLYALIEQQREVQALMILRMSSYMGRQWERLARDQPSLERLPPIIPILLHHSETGWTAATCFEDIIETGVPARAALLPYIPRFRMLLCDLSPGRASGLAKEALTALGRGGTVESVGCRR